MCHPGAFRQALIKACADGFRNLQHTESVAKPYDEDTGNNAENSEPVRLVKSRSEREVQRCSLLIPDAVAVACDHTKPIVPRRQVGVGNFPSAYRPAPVVIVALEFVTELDVFRCCQAESRVFKLEISGSWLETQPRRRCESPIIRFECLDCDRRRHDVFGQVPWVDHGNALAGGKPEPPINGSC